MNTQEKIESNELLQEQMHRVNVLMIMESGRLTSKVRKDVEYVLDQEREKLRRHVEMTLK